MGIHYSEVGTLLHIGSLRTGSTFLQHRWFPEHPDLTVINDLDTSAIRTQAQACGHSADYFVVTDERLGSLSSPKRIMGIDYDPSTDIRAYQRLVCSILYDIFGDSYILLVTRGYKSFLTSLYSLYIKSGGVYTFPVFWDKYKKIVSAISDYSHLLTTYIERFSYERVICLPYEMLRDDSSAFFSTIEERLGVQQWHPKGRAINRSLRESELKGYLGLSRMVNTLISLQPFLSEDNLFRRYYHLLIQDKLKSLSKFCRTFFPKKPKLDTKNIDLSKHFGGNSDRLKERDQYRKYKNEYLIE